MDGRVEDAGALIQEVEHRSQVARASAPESEERSKSNAVRRCGIAAYASSTVLRLYAESGVAEYQPFGASICGLRPTRVLYVL
jgi:hypothetical protein